MKVCMVARDAAPSRAFVRFKTELERRGHEVCGFLGDGKPLSVSLDEIGNKVEDMDIAVIGMSSSEELAEPELAALAAAHTCDVSFGFYLDTANCHNREWFGEYRNQARFFFAVNEREQKKVAAAYPEALVVATGNPLREDAFFPKFTHNQVREKLGVTKEETLVLAPGGKSPVVNILVWGALLEALARVPNRMIRVALTCHPGDRTPFAIDPAVVQDVYGEGIEKAQLNLYGDLVKFAPKSAIPMKVGFVLKSVISTDDMVPGADLIVEFASTIGINAAAQRKPVVSIDTAIGMQRLFSASKTPNTESVELGLAASCRAGNSEGMVNCIANLLVPNGFAPYRAKQEEECPTPAKQGEAVKLMADELERLL